MKKDTVKTILFIIITIVIWYFLANNQKRKRHQKENPRKMTGVRELNFNDSTFYTHFEIDRVIKLKHDIEASKKRNVNPRSMSGVDTLFWEDSAYIIRFIIDKVEVDREGNYEPYKERP